MPPLDDHACTELFRIGSRGGGAFPAPGDLFESIIEDIYTALLKPGDIALDGGAHVGRHAFPMAERVGSKGLVLAVEAYPKLARGLVRRAKKRSLPQVQVVERALYARIGRVPFHCVAKHTAYSGIEARRYDFDDRIRAIEVEATTIDALVAARTGCLHFCKLDLEGGELRALQGGLTALNRFRPLVVFENDQENSARNYGYSKDEWFGFFERAGYGVFTLWGGSYGRKDWGRRDIPWYFIAAAADSPESDFIAGRVPMLVSKYLQQAPRER